MAYTIHYLLVADNAFRFRSEGMKCVIHHLLLADNSFASLLSHHEEPSLGAQGFQR